MNGVSLKFMQHPTGNSSVSYELNPNSLETVEIDLPQRPLSIDSIHDIFGICALNPTVTLTWEQCEEIARMIEERHGIK